MANTADTKPSADTNNAETNEKVMPFLDHLEELRKRLLKSIIAVTLTSLGCYFYAQKIMNFLLRPYPHEKKLIFLAPTESFMIHLKVAIFAGILISLPIIFYQLWKFVAPGLYKKERKYALWIVVFSTFFFLTGAIFCYYLVIPYGLNFLLSFGTDRIEANIQIKEYIKFVTLLIFAFGIMFELPLLSLFLTKLGLLTPQFLRSKRRYSIVGIFILAAVITPTTDVVTQTMLAGPLIILYEISIWVCKFALPKSRAKEAKHAT